MKLHPGPSFQVPYLNQETIEEFANLRIKTESGKFVNINLLLLVSWCKFPKDLLEDAIAHNEELVISSNLKDQDVVLVRDFIMKGVLPFDFTDIVNGKLPHEINDIFNCFGIDLMALMRTSFFKEEENGNVPLEPVKERKSKKRKYSKRSQGKLEPRVLMKLDPATNIKYELNDENQSFMDDNDLIPKKEPLDDDGDDCYDGQIEDIPEEEDIDDDEYKPIVKTVKRKAKSVKSNHNQAEDEDQKFDVVCEDCGKVYRHRKDLMIHKDAAHAPSQEWPCNQCEKVFTTKLRLYRHVTTIHNKKPCPLCGQMFHAKRMKVHMITNHSEDTNRPFNCEVCHKGFMYKQKLKIHMNIHSGVKPYVCKYCGKGFSDVSNMRMHERTTHEGYKRPEKIKKVNMNAMESNGLLT